MKFLQVSVLLFLSLLFACSNQTKEEKSDEIKRMEVYAAMIDRMDQNIGRVLEKLNETGKLDNTPMIAWWPGKINAGSFSEFPGHFIDFMSTFVELTCAEYPEEFNNQEITPMQGQSFLPVLLGEKLQRGKPLFWEWAQGQAVYKDSWKLVRHGLNNPWELYNLQIDPVETNNLAETEPEKMNELQLLFQDWKNELMGQHLLLIPKTCSTTYKFFVPFSILPSSYMQKSDKTDKIKWN